MFIAKPSFPAQRKLVSSINATVLMLSSLLLSFPLYADEESPALGQRISPEEVAAIDLIVEPDGTGLPEGQGNARQGRAIYERQCLVCHGAQGEGVQGAPALAGGDMNSEGPPLRTVGSYWPLTSTLFDFIRRAMPANAPKTLSNDEVYAVTAYVLNMSDIVAADTVLDASNLADIKMPNSEGFVDQSDKQ